MRREVGNSPGMYESMMMLSGLSHVGFLNGISAGISQRKLMSCPILGVTVSGMITRISSGNKNRKDVNYLKSISIQALQEVNIIRILVMKVSWIAETMYGYSNNHRMELSDV